MDRYIDYGEWGGRLVRRRWTPFTLFVAAIVGVVVVSLVVALAVLAVIAAAAVAAAYIAYRGARALLASGAPAQPKRPALQTNDRELRGFMEMARTPDPLDRFLLSVREFDRLSEATLAVDPADLARKKTVRRAASLSEQAFNLNDAVIEIERQVSADSRSEGALANVWELSVATGELWAYSRDLANVRHTPSLAQVRWLVARRTALLARRDALVNRLRDAELRPALAARP